MVKIRKGMFETNSSSTHTIIVTNQNCEPGAIVDFRIGEFGWEFRRLDTIDEKASYLYTMGCYIYDRDIYQDLYEILCKYGVKCTCTEPAEFDKKSGWLVNGYVDHGGVDDSKQFVDDMLSHEKLLIRYLFSPESFVITGNDNCSNKDYDWKEKQCDVDYKHKTYYKGN